LHRKHDPARWLLLKDFIFPRQRRAAPHLAAR
jgi:hypothetical protein